jgi:proteasome accessory factor C
LTRLLSIVTFLEDHGPTPFEDLASHFGVPTDQIRRDVELLWVAGLPGHMPHDLVDFDAVMFEAGVADLTNSQGLAQVRLSAREAVALVGALSTLVAAGTAPEAASSALVKLRGASEAAAAITVVPTSAVDPAVTDTLTQAMGASEAVEVHYVSAQDRRTERVIEPHRLVTIDGVAYVECFCKRAGDYRTLRVDRIQSATRTGARIEHGPSDADGFSLAPRFEAKVVVARSGRWALEDLPGVVINEAGDDVEATFGVADAMWVAGRLLAVSPHLRAVEPKDLRDAVARQARAVLAAQAD